MAGQLSDGRRAREACMKIGRCFFRCRTLAGEWAGAHGYLSAGLRRGRRRLWQMAAGAVATALILIAMGRMEWLRSAWLADAWRQERSLVLWMALLQTAAGLFQGVRYHAMLRATRGGTRMDESVGATCVSTGLSIWLPASPAVAELLRLGLLCRRGSPERLVRLGRVTLASLMDRLLGLFTVFLLKSAFYDITL